MYSPLTALFATVLAGQQASAPASDQKDLAEIGGRVTSPDGQPLRKCTVNLLPFQTLPGEAISAYRANSGADGKFVFAGVKPGHYTLTAHHGGYLRTAYGAKKNAGQGTALTLIAGTTVKDLTIQLVPQGTISGKVTDDEGDPAAQVRVNLLRQDFIQGKREFISSNLATETDEAGEYKISGLSAGRYYLTAEPRGQHGEVVPRAAAITDSDQPEEQLVTTYYPGAPDQTSATRLEIVAGRNLSGTDIQLRKSQVFRVRGKVTGSAADAALQTLRVIAAPRKGSLNAFEGAGSVIAKDGSFELAGLQPGSYFIAVVSTNGEGTLASRPLDVGSHNVEGVVLVMHPLGSLTGSITVEGQVNPAKGKALKGTAGISLFIMRVDGPVLETPMATVNPDGTFTLDHISPGRYCVKIFDPPDGTYVKSAVIGMQNALDGAEVSSGSGTLDIVLSPGPGQIDGTVEIDPKTDVSGTTVTLIPDPPSPEKTDLYATTVADQTGHFTIRNRPPGKYKLYAWEDLESGQQFDLDFMQPLEGKGVKITVEENGQHQVSITRISAAQAEAK